MVDPRINMAPCHIEMISFSYVFNNLMCVSEFVFAHNMTYSCQLRKKIPLLMIIYLFFALVSF